MGWVKEAETEYWCIVSVDPAEVPPPGAGLKTVIEGVPSVVISEAGMAAVSCPVLTKVVVLADPLILITDAVLKFDPSTVSVKAGSPAQTEEGVISAITGTGLVMLKEELVAPVKAGALELAVKVYPVPDLSIDKSVKVASPVMVFSATVNVPANTPPGPALVPIASVISFATPVPLLP